MLVEHVDTCVEHVDTLGHPSLWEDPRPVEADHISQVSSTEPPRHNGPEAPAAKIFHSSESTDFSRIQGLTFLVLRFPNLSQNCASPRPLGWMEGE